MTPSDEQVSDESVAAIAAIETDRMIQSIARECQRSRKLMPYVQHKTGCIVASAARIYGDEIAQGFIEKCTCGLAELIGGER